MVSKLEPTPYGHYAPFEDLEMFAFVGRKFILLKIMLYSTGSVA